MSLGSMKFEVNSDTGFVTVGYGAGSSPTFTRVRVGDGTAAAPSYSFINDSTTGFYRLSGNQIGVSINGVHAGNFWSTGANSIRFAGAANNFFECSNNGWIQIVAAGTNQNIYITPSGSGWVALPNNSNSQLGLSFGQAVSNASNYFNSGNGAGWVMHFTTGSSQYNASNVRLTITDSNLWTPSSINLLLGTNVDSANGRLQLATHTAIAGGIGFGTDTSLYRAAAGALMLTDGTVTGLFWARTANSALEIGPQSNHSLILRTNNTVALTLDTSQNVTFSKELFLGSSGPAVSSTLNAKSSRQGLTFNGITGASVASIPAFGTSNFTVVIWVKPNNITGTQCFLGGAVNSFVFRMDSGVPGIGKQSVNNTAISSSAITANRNTFIAYTKSSTTGTGYVNGIAASTITDSNDYTVADTLIGCSVDTATAVLNGTLSILVFNRALSAAEIVALYETGNPVTADYNSASYTSINAASVVNGNQAGSFLYDTFSGASATGFTAVKTQTATEADVYGGEGYTVSAGQQMRVSFTCTLTSGTLPAFYFSDFSNAPLYSSGGGYQVVAGVNTVIIPITANGTGVRLRFYSSTAQTVNYAISNLSVTRLGLLVAPDATQPGGGLSWYDNSGNNRTITLPATGVSWNVPTSGYYTTTGALNLTGGANLILTASTGNLYLRSSVGGVIFDTGSYFLFGTATNSSNGIIQLATHTTSTGGIGFGADISLYRQSSTNLYTTALRFASSTAGNFYLATATNSQLVLQTNLTNALIIDTAQNVTTTATLITAASVVGQAGLRLPHGAAPTAPVNGDIWTTTAGLYVRINGVTVGPLT